MRTTQARMARHRRRLALGVLLGAVALAIAAVPFRATWWGGWILAIAEAGVVGGLADWFAVTALFRRPLGLPIPHTGLIPANWELMAARVGTMVGDRVLTAEYVSREIARADLAGLLARAAALVKPTELEAGVRAAARWAADQLSPEAAADLAGWLHARLVSQPIAPVLAEMLDVAQRQGWDQRLIEALTEALGSALDRPEIHEAVGDAVDVVLGDYRQRLGFYPSLLIGLAGMLGLIDRKRLIGALRSALHNVASDPNDPLRRHLGESLAGLPARLRSDTDLAARVEAAKLELLNTPAVGRLIEDGARGLHRALQADVGTDDSAVVGWISAQLEAARQALASDPVLYGQVDGWMKRQAIALVEAHHQRIAAFIERGVRSLGAEGAVHLVEEHAGDDLQFIRVNGTVVGGLAGGAIYGVHILLRLF